MGRLGACAVCSRPDRDVLDGLAALGGSIRSLARDHGVPEPTLRRHLKRCRKPAVAKRGLPEAPALPPDELPVLPVLPLLDGDPVEPFVRQFEDQYRTTKAAFDGEPDTHRKAFLAVQARNTLAALSREYAGRRQEPTSEARLLDHPDFAGFMAVLGRVLDRHPEARADLVAEAEAVLAGISEVLCA